VPFITLTTSPAAAPFAAFWMVFHGLAREPSPFVSSPLSADTKIS
jgi:hypothetical protein